MIISFGQFCRFPDCRYPTPLPMLDFSKEELVVGGKNGVCPSCDRLTWISIRERDYTGYPNPSNYSAVAGLKQAE